MRRSPPFWAKAVFGLAQRAHPRTFRDRYGAEMRAVFDDGFMQAGGSARLAYVARSVAQSVATGLRQRFSGSAPLAPERHARDVWRLDLKHAVRSVVRRPALAALVVMTLGVGVGANAAVFGTLHSVVLAPLPYGEPDQLVRLYQRDRDDPQLSGYLTLPALIHYRENARTLASLAAVYTYEAEGADLTDLGRPERVRVLGVGADYFETLRVRPTTGRPFRREEERAGAGVALVSAALAERLSGRVVVTLDGEPRDVIGVMPPDFADPLMGVIDVWLPLDLPSGGWEAWQWDNHYLSAIARLAPSASLVQARQEIARLSELQRELSGLDAEFYGELVPLHDDIVGESDTLLAILMGAVSVLLLLTFVNVAVLLVARALDRTHEVAVRTALGSPRRRLARQLLFEGLSLSMAGGAAGVLIALPLARVLRASAPSGLLETGADPPLWPMLLFGALAALVAGVAFGMVSSAGLRSVGAADALRQAGRGSDRRTAGKIREGLVVTQIALALVLLIGAGVLLESLERLRRVELNLRSDAVLTYELHLPAIRYGEPESQIAFRRELMRRVTEIPGVRSVGAISLLPVTGRGFIWGVTRNAEESRGDVRFASADQRVVSGDAMEVLGIPLLYGRAFAAHDDGGADPRVMINATLARALFDDLAGAVGRQIRVGGEQRTVIGVVADVPVRTRGEVAPMVYHSDLQFSQSWTRSLVQLVALEAGARGVFETIVREVAALDPDLVVYRPRPLMEVIGLDTARERFAARLVTAFAALAAAVSVLGLYGVLAHAVRRRRREIGIRLALGAPQRTVLVMVVWRALQLALIGVALGIGAAILATRGLEALVFGVGVRDAGVFLAAAALMTAVATAAALLPAFQATRVDPADTFRGD